MNIYRSHVLSYLTWRFVLRKPRVRRFLTSILVKDADVDIQLFGAPLRINKRKEFGYWKAYLDSTRNIVFRDESATLLNLALLLAPGDTFVDVGANVGLYSSVLTKAADTVPGLRFYSFEAHPETFQRLRHSLAGRSVDCRNLAMSDRKGRLEFGEGATSGVFGISGAMSEGKIKGEIKSVPADTLDEAGIIGNSIVLKIDVEGHEKEVLDGATRLFEEGRIKAVYLDGFSDGSIPETLVVRGFRILHGRTMQAVETPECSSLLAVRDGIAGTPAR